MGCGGRRVRRARWLLSLLLLVAAVAPASAARAETRPEDGLRVRADGLAAIENGNVMAAREQAIADALQRAVEQATGGLLPADVLVREDPLLRGRIYTDAVRYVQSYRITTETPVGRLYQISVEAIVAREALRQTLVRLGVLAPDEVPTGPFGVVTVTARGATRHAHLAALIAALTDRAQARRIRYRALAPATITIEAETPLAPSAVAGELARLQVEGAYLTVASPDGSRLEVVFTPTR